LNADMNEVCDDGLSPLSFAKNDENVIRTLVKLGADVNKADEDGQTPLMYSIKDGEDRVKLLLALGADKTIKDKEGNTAYDLVKNKKTAGDGIKTLLK
ncbi:MAG: ankyrin repeat domain-containing protein, partial [Candidatus Thiodiazotropha sp. (ex Notomyrtea botanica)]|nr:ankyrin repeat domain-containing protein [Candidatus Thiodiazotropha sp. (ex Notomyrtea botanica)]